MKSFFARTENHRLVGLPVMDERQTLLDELRKAHLDWLNAQQLLDWVLDRDQIDYAIYALEAAEKKYEMLLRQAKQLSWNAAHHSSLRKGS